MCLMTSKIDPNLGFQNFKSKTQSTQSKISKTQSKTQSNTVDTILEIEKSNRRNSDRSGIADAPGEL